MPKSAFAGLMIAEKRGMPPQKIIGMCDRRMRSRGVLAVALWRLEIVKSWELHV